MVARQSLSDDRFLVQRRTKDFVQTGSHAPTAVKKLVKLWTIQIVRHLQRRFAFVVLLILRTTGVEKKLAYVQTARMLVRSHSTVQKRVTVAVRHVLCTTRVEEKLAELHAARVNGLLQGRKATGIAVVLYTTRGEQKLAQFRVVRGNGTVQKRVAFAILLNTVTAGVEKNLTELWVVRKNSMMQRRVTFPVLRILRTTGVEQELTQVAVVVHHSRAQRVVSASRPNHANLEVQPAQTQVARSRRTTEAVEADIPLLLAQLGDGKRSLCRRNGDNAALRQAEHTVVVVDGMSADLQAHRLHIQFRQRLLKALFQIGQAPTLGVHLHRHFRTSRRCRHVHCVCCFG
eukprot:Rhum_TRINITY_DN10545_c0_g1::Rhum_TRINITY_DN10545_c0_g1_i1::g.38966::m.38966